jgi:hypothetical protein
VVSTLAISKRGLLDDTPEKCTSYGTTCSTWTRNMKKPHKDGLCSSYHLVMTNTSPWKIPIKWEVSPRFAGKIIDFYLWIYGYHGFLRLMILLDPDDFDGLTRHGSTRPGYLTVTVRHG